MNSEKKVYYTLNTDHVQDKIREFINIDAYFMLKQSEDKYIFLCVRNSRSHIFTACAPKRTDRSVAPDTFIAKCIETCKPA